MIDLIAIEARAQAATQGPWEVESRGMVVDIIAPREISKRPWIASIPTNRDGSIDPEANEKADFIAHARQDVPDLIAEVQRLREAIEGACAALRSPVMWSNPEKYLKTGVPQIEKTLYGKLEPTPETPRDESGSSGN